MTSELQDRPEVLHGRTERITTPCGGFYLTLNENDFKLFEVRMLIGKSGSCQRMLFETIAILLSVLLQSGISKEKISDILLKKFESNCGQKFYFKGEEYHSCLDFVVRRMIEELGNRGEIKLEGE